MPITGVAVDRRVLRGLNAFLPEVKTLMCFCCAQNNSYAPLWRNMYNRSWQGKHNDPETNVEWHEHKFDNHSKNMIEMLAVEDSLRRYYRRDEDRFRLHFDLRQFKARYASEDHADGNPFQNSTTLDEGSREWIQRTSLDQQKRDELLLCCPEDVERCAACARKDDGSLCH